MAGVINTISGSIPSTGFSVTSNIKPSSNAHTISTASDLNAVMNNSRISLNKLNGLHRQQQPHHAIQLKQQQQQQQQQLLHETYVPYSHSSQTCPIPERNANSYLWIVTPVAASISVAIVIAALAGPQWLFTEEKLPNFNYNGSANFNALDDVAFITKYTKSSLWILCSTIQGVEKYNCIKIDYFSREGYQLDPQDSTAAIPYTVIKSCPLFLISGLFLLLSFIVFLVPTCSHQNNLYYFSAGIMFIVSGLLMFIGLIAYISILKAEIGSKLRPRSTLQMPLFKVTYGQSFFLYVFGFIATEFVGLLNIFLYTSLQEVSYYSRLSCFTLSSLKQKIREGEHHCNHTYKGYKNDSAKRKETAADATTVTTTTATAAIDNRHKNQRNRKHQLHLTTPESRNRIDYKKLSKNSGRLNGETFACRKHPNGMASTMFLYDLNRRYYFERPDNNCNLHSKTKSMTELYREAAPLISSPPLPHSILRSQKVLFHTVLPQPPQQFSDSPPEFPLTRSVSTTTDIYGNSRGSSIIGGGHSDTKPTTTINTTTSHMTGSNNHKIKTTNNNYNNNNNRRRSVATSTYCGNNTFNTQTKNIENNVVQLNGKEMDVMGIRAGQNQQEQEQQQQHQHQVTDNYNNRKQFKIAIKDTHGVNDEDDADAEQPKSLCGLKKGLRRTKDELFEEFCKKAGVRPKPKNIYYITNEHSDAEPRDVPQIKSVVGTKQQPKRTPFKTLLHRPPPTHNNTLRGVHDVQHQSRENITKYQSNLIGLGLHATGNNGNRGINNSIGHMNGERILLVNDNGNNNNGDVIVDMDVDEDENENNSYEDDGIDENQCPEDDEVSFEKQQGEAEHEQQQQQHQFLANGDARSLFQMKTNNYDNSQYLEPNHLKRLNSNQSLHALYATTTARGLQRQLYEVDGMPLYYSRQAYGGSQNHLHSAYNQPIHIYETRTLPRTMFKRSAEEVYNQQPENPANNVFSALAQENNVHNVRVVAHKSSEDLHNYYERQQQQQQQQQQQIQKPIYLQAQCQAAAPASIAYNNQIPKQPPAIKWPAAIPSSPSNFLGNYRIYDAIPSMQSPDTESNLTVRNNNLLGRSQTQLKIPTTFAYEEQKRQSQAVTTAGLVTDAFDLDEIEWERRRSHASLFNPNTNININAVPGDLGKVSNTHREHYDMINGTAV